MPPASTRARSAGRITVIASMIGLTFLAISQGPAVLASAGPDRTATVPDAITLDGTGSTGASTYDWQLTYGPTGAGSCAYVYGAATQEMWQCTDGGACWIYDAESASASARCMMGDDDGSGAGTYTFTLSINAGASTDTMTADITCTTPAPGYPRFCAEAYTYDLDTHQSAVASFGTQTVPAFPTVPTVTYTATCGTADCVRAETDATWGSNTCQAVDEPDTCANKKVTLSGNIAGDVFLWGANNVTIDLNGYTVNRMAISCQGCADAADGLHIYDGTIGQFESGANSYHPTDVLLDGVTIDAEQYGGGVHAVSLNGCTRCSFVNSTVAGPDTDPGNLGGAVIATGTSLTFLNSNLEGRNADDGKTNWGIRWGNTCNNCLAADVMVQAHSYAVTRQVCGDAVIYSTLGCRGQTCESALIGTERGNMDASYGDGSIVCPGATATCTDYVARWHVRYYQSRTNGTDTPLWGPETAAANRDNRWLYGGLTVYSDGAYMTAATFATREAAVPGDDVWDLDADTTHANSYSAAALSLPSWPTRNGCSSAGLSCTTGDPNP